MKPTNQILTGNGNLSTTTGVLGTVGDCNLKTDIVPVDTREVLERLGQVRIQEWRFRRHDPAERHLGPMAQDFHAAFGLGTDDQQHATLLPPAPTHHCPLNTDNKQQP